MKHTLRKNLPNECYTAASKRADLTMISDKFTKIQITKTFRVSKHEVEKRLQKIIKFNYFRLFQEEATTEYNYVQIR